MLLIESDDKKAWIPSKHSPFIMNLFKALPGKKKFQKGIPYFEMSRKNLEKIDSSSPDAIWSGPAAEKIKNFRLMRETEKKSREQQISEAGELEDFPFKTTPYDHQKKAFMLSRRKEFFGYFMEMGTGKTKVILDNMADIYLHGGDNGPIDTFVVIAPNGVHNQWVNEQLPAHLTDSIPYKAAYTSASPSAEEKKAMQEMIEFKGGLRVLSVHIDMLSHKKGQQFLTEFLSGCKAYMAIDESSRIKDMSSKRTKIITALGPLCSYRRIATGTPVTQGVQDLYSQLAFLSEDILGYSSFYAFRNYFCTMGGFQNKKITGHKNEAELIAKMDAHTFRVTKEECLDLPEIVRVRREVPLHPEQAKIYNEMKKDFFLALDDGMLTAQMAMTRMTRLQQIVSGFVWRREKKDENGTVVTPELYQEFPNNRVQTTIDILQESANEAKFIIWVKFMGDLRLLSKALEKAGIKYVTYTGSTDKKQSEDNLTAFKEDKTVKVLISSPKKGGTGLNLTVANNVIWFARDFSLENELQANDRCHRIGQLLKVTYFYLVSPKTVDEKIEKIQRMKLSTAENLIDFRDFVE